MVGGKVVEERGEDFARERALVGQRLAAGFDGGGFRLLLRLPGLLLLRLVLLVARAPVEVGGGELETVEEQAGAARVDVVEGERGDDRSEGLLDGVARGGPGQLDGVAAGLGTGAGQQLFLVEVAEVLVAESVAAAAAVVGKTVVATKMVRRLVARLDSLFRHGYSPRY